MIMMMIRSFNMLTMQVHDTDYDETDNFTCLCSENTCNYLMIIKHKPTDINMALGSICYTRFDEYNIDDILKEMVEYEITRT